MKIGSIIAVYFVVWWMTLFVVLPFGIRSQQEAGAVVTGTDPGAPASVRLMRIVLMTTVLSAIFLAVFWFGYVENVFDIKLIRDLNRS
jgi:predicted secreted protein